MATRRRRSLLFQGAIALLVSGLAFAQKTGDGLIAQAQKAVQVKIIRDRGTGASLVLFNNAEKYSISRAQQGVRGTGVFKRDQRTVRQEFSYNVIIQRSALYRIGYISYTLKTSVPPGR